MLQARKCGECGVDFEILTHNGEAFVVSTEGRWTGVCPECGSGDIIKKVGVVRGIELGGEAGYGKVYPYFDRGLKCRVSSAAHRRQIMRERGLVEAGGCGDFIELQAKKDLEVQNGYIKKMRSYHKRLDEDSAFGDYRRLRDKGYYDENRG